MLSVLGRKEAAVFLSSLFLSLKPVSKSYQGSQIARQAVDRVCPAMPGLVWTWAALPELFRLTSGGGRIK